MKVILEIEYHASEWTSIGLIKSIVKQGITAKIYKIEPTSPANSPNKTQSHFNIAFIKRVVSSCTNMPENAFEIQSRSQEIAENRQIAMYLCRKYTRKSLREIGAEFGNKTPATILHACKAIQNLEQTDKSFRKKLAYIESNLTSSVR